MGSRMIKVNDHRIKTGKGKVGQVSQQGTEMWRWTRLRALLWNKPASSGVEEETGEVRARVGGWEMQLVEDKKEEGIIMLSERNPCLETRKAEEAKEWCIVAISFWGRGY